MASSACMWVHQQMYVSVWQHMPYDVAMLQGITVLLHPHAAACHEANESTSPYANGVPRVNVAYVCGNT